MGVAPEELDCVAAYLDEVQDFDVRVYGVGIEDSAAGPFVDTVGALALFPERLEG